MRSTTKLRLEHFSIFLNIFGYIVGLTKRILAEIRQLHLLLLSVRREAVFPTTSKDAGPGALPSAGCVLAFDSLQLVWRLAGQKE